MTGRGEAPYARRERRFDMKKFFTVKNLCLSGIIAALYVVLTVLLQAISFGGVQLRVSEAMTLLPVLTPAAIPGLTIGCLISNVIASPFGWADWVFGTLATLIAAVLTRAFRKNLYVATMMPVLSNALIVGTELYYLALAHPEMEMNPDNWSVWIFMLSVGVGEAVACFVLGHPLVHALKKVPNLFD